MQYFDDWNLSPTQKSNKRGCIQKSQLGMTAPCWHAIVEAALKPPLRPRLCVGSRRSILEISIIFLRLNTPTRLDLEPIGSFKTASNTIFPLNFLKVKKLIRTFFSIPPAVRNKLNLYWALSRTPHGLIDMTTPALAALLCLGHLPPFPVILIGIITAFAGYTAVYAVNDLTDYHSDRKKAAAGGFDDSEDYLDGVMIRHPLAKGVLSYASGLAWAVGWSIVAMAGAYILNPVCLWIFLAGCLLEIIYCLLGTVTPQRALVNGLVKTCGPLAAVFAVTPSPNPVFLAALFLWIFFWEIGGQNIPADWTDIEEDRRFNAKTIPASLGLQRAGLLSLTCLVVAQFLTFGVFWASPLTFGPLYLFAALGINTGLLLLPALQLAETCQREKAMALFNRASYYPLAFFILVLVRMVQPALLGAT